MVNVPAPISRTASRFPSTRWARACRTSRDFSQTWLSRKARSSWSRNPRPTYTHALKALLDLIEQSASRNQFLISTHSNIVVRHLGAIPDSHLFYVHAEPGVLPPTATVQPVDHTTEARIAALRDLGYRFSDFDLWDDWLILEESSAERIIRD
jgi:hypothetical protein